MPERNGAVRVGVYVCHCGSNIAGIVDCKEVAEYAAGLIHVVVSRDYKYMCSDPGQDLIRNDIQEHKLNRIVVAACSPHLHEHTFRVATANGGLNPYYMTMVNIREQDSWVHTDRQAATEKASDLVRAAIRRVVLQRPLEKARVPIDPNVLVVGGGIAGIHAALTLANAGKHVYLVEREATIGGHMAMFDKTFPTLDCAACILTPKMSAVKAHPNITLWAYSDVEKVDGYVGNYKVRVRRRTRYIREDLCAGCQECIEACVYKQPKFADEFNQGLGKRRPIYLPFPQAIPQTPVIDRDTCIEFNEPRKIRWLTSLSQGAFSAPRGQCCLSPHFARLWKSGKCKKTCLEACGDRHAIDFKLQDQLEEIKVGTIILATGFQPFDAKRIPYYGYGHYPNVYTSLEIERLVNASGPAAGEVVLRDGKTVPKSIGIIHCVGSRDENTNRWCSRVCCMYSLKLAHLLKEHTGADIFNFYIDMRTPGKSFEEFYQRLLSEGVHFIRGKVAEVTDWVFDPSEEGKLTLRVEDTLLGVVRRIPVDMVVLSVGMEGHQDAQDVRRLFNITCSTEGFFQERHPKLAPVNTFTDGIFLAGCCQGPKDIPDTVAQAGAAAAEALALICAGYVEQEPNCAYVIEEECSGCKTCIPLCPYSAISFREDNRAEVNPVLCKGCGTCVAACPSGSLQQRMFEDDELFEEIEGVLVHA